MSPAPNVSTSTFLTVELNARELQIARAFLQKLASAEERLAERAHELHASTGDDSHEFFAREIDERAQILKRLHHSFPA